MQFKIFNGGILLLAITAAGAQVASHAPTVFTQPAPQGQAPAMTPLVASSKPVARVNGSVLTEADLVREEFSIFPYARQHGGLPKQLASQIRAGAMKMIIFEELVYQEALRRKLTVPATKMQKAETDFRKQFTSPGEFNALLQSEFHGSRKLLQDKIRRSLLIEVLLNTEIEKRSIATPAEVRAYYEKSQARFQNPETFTFQTVSVLPPPNATAEQLKEGRTRAEAALRQAKATKTSEEFGVLAEKISDDDYRVMMGQHKPEPVDQLAPQVVKALLAIKPGEITGLIQLDQAYTIVRLGAHTPAGKTSFEDLRVKLAKELTDKKKEQLRAELDQKLRQNAKIEEL